MSKTAGHPLRNSYQTIGSPQIMNDILYRVGIKSRKYVTPILQKIGLFDIVARTYTSILFHFSGNTVQISLDDISFKMLAETRDEYNIVNFGLRTEEKEVQRFLQDIEPSDIIWDVGGHIGFWSCAAAQKNRYRR